MGSASVSELPFGFDGLVEAYGSQRAMNHHIHVWQDPKFIYFANPKVACSSTKASLNMAVAARTGAAYEIGSMKDIHPRWKGLIPTPLNFGREAFAAMMGDSDAMRFTFVRDPVRRLASAWLSKLGEPVRTRSRHWLRLRTHLGREAEDGVSLAEFARLCREDPVVLDMDPHWRPQRRQIAFDHVDWGFIGDHADFATGFAAVTARIFGAPIPVFDTRSAFGRHTASAKVSQEISAEILDDIRAAFADDYAMLEEIADRGLGTLPS